MKIPEPIYSLESLIYAAYEADEEKPRPHMGASLLGHPCDRWLWLSFRHAVREQFSGRMRLLFKRGHDEEARVIHHLRRIGAHVESTGAKQSRFNFGSHVEGSADGIVSNLPTAPKSKAILEIKTHSDKSFTELKKNGVIKSKPMHWVQCCIYGFGKGLDRALYFAVNKNTDEIYTEWLHLDKEVAEKAISRGKRLALQDRIPEPLSADPTWYQCRFCPAHSFCHKAEPTKYANCRTCAHSTAKADSTWRCERHQADGIPVEFQHEGCDDHILHPDLVPWRMISATEDDHVVWAIGGREVLNGRNGYKSREIVANPSACGDPMVEAAKREFPDAEVVG